MSFARTFFAPDKNEVGKHGERRKTDKQVNQRFGLSDYLRRRGDIELLADELNTPVKALLFHRKNMYRIDSDGMIIEALDL